MRRRGVSEEGPEDLNLVPYMDIMVNLILFLLVATTFAAELHQVPTTPPGAGKGGEGPSIVVFVGREGVTLTDRGTQRRLPAAAWPALGAELQKIRSERGDDVVGIAAAADVPFDDVMAAVDAVEFRADGSRLFSAFTLLSPT